MILLTTYLQQCMLISIQLLPSCASSIMVRPGKYAGQKQPGQLPKFNTKHFSRACLVHIYQRKIYPNLPQIFLNLMILLTNITQLI